MRVVRLINEPDWKSLLSPIEEIFFATSASAKTLRPDERQPFRERWLGRYIAHDIESFFVAIARPSIPKCRGGRPSKAGTPSAMRWNG